MTPALPARTGAGNGDPIATALWAAVEQEFLELLGWDPEVRVLHFPQEHPQMGVPVCINPGCGCENVVKVDVIGSPGYS
ncbi:hypothetical protein [Kitasatospora griseola]|uniref:hypothetical protein n=1 Tax=Kitasatospora griseola TaxID=2064 RepID=UPI00341D19AA